MTNVDIGCLTKDVRAPFWLRDVQNVYFEHVMAPYWPPAAMMNLYDVKNITTVHVADIPDQHLDVVGREDF